MGSQYTIEQSAGGVVTLYEKTVTGNSYVSLKTSGVNIKGTKGFGFNDQWSFSHDLPQNPSLGGRGLKVQFGRGEQGTDVIVKGYSVDLADVVGAKPLDFVISFDENGNATNLKVGATYSADGVSASAGFSIDPHNPSDASQLRSITYDPNGNTYVTQYNISSSHAPYALVKVYGPTGLLIDELQRPIDPDIAAQISSGFLTPNDQCFLAETPISMWPTDPLFKPKADGTWDEELVLSKVWTKPISEIAVGDLVVSYDDKGRIYPGTVNRTMQNHATHILEFWGTGVTPGHAYLCGDGKFKDQHVPLMDILRTDGAIVRDNGTLIRAATNYEVGSMADMMIHATASMQKPDGSWTPQKTGKVRFGTRIILPDGKHMSFFEMAQQEGWKVSEDGYMVAMMKTENGVQEKKFHFPYAHGENLPKPEDYILQRSDVTLESIYAAGEWEQIGTRMPAPEGMIGLNTNHTSTLLQPSKPEPNIPPAFASRPDAPRRSERSLNRKQRKAQEAKQRKAAKKTHKRLVS